MLNHKLLLNALGNQLLNVPDGGLTSKALDNQMFCFVLHMQPCQAGDNLNDFQQSTHWWSGDDQAVIKHDVGITFRISLNISC